MMWATVLVLSDDKNQKRGKFSFVQLPSPGDQIQIMSERQHIDLLLVKYVQHTPAPSVDLGDLQELDRPYSHLTDGTVWTPPTDPIAHVVCELLAEF
jgi:hypothetical protein